MPDMQQVDLGVPQVLRRENASQHAREFVIGTAADGSPVHHPAFTAATTAFGTIHDAAAKLAEGERAIQTTRDAAQDRRLRAAAAKALAGALKAAESGLETIAQHRAKVEDQIDQAIGIPTARTGIADGLRAEGIRGHLRALPTPAARMAAAQEAITAGDAEAAAAILSASPLASGLGRGDAKVLRMAAEAKFAPQQTRLRASIDKLARIVDRAGKASESRFGPLVGTGDTPHARAERALASLEGGAA